MTNKYQAQAKEAQERNSRIYQVARGCSRKKVYESKVAAERGCPTSQAVYRCQFCGKYHRSSSYQLRGKPQS